MIDFDEERAASLQRLGITPEEMLPPMCSCGKPVAPKRRKYCSAACLRLSMDYSARKGKTSYADEVKARHARFVALREDGWTLREIAEVEHVHISTVVRALKGITRKWDKTRVSLCVDRQELLVWRDLATAGDQTVQRFIYDVVSSEVERRTSLYYYLKAGRQR